MTHADRIIAFLQRNPDRWFSDDEISAALAIRPRQTVNQVARRLAQENRILRELVQGKTRNTIPSSKISDTVLPEGEVAPIPQSSDKSSDALPGLSPKQFEELAARAMSAHFAKALRLGTVPGIPKRFDFVSPDGTIVGDAKYFTLVGGERLPPAKFSVIAEYVWLLQHAEAERRFLVFGNDRRVPERWLKTYGRLANGVEFYFLDVDGNVHQLS